MIKRRKCVKKTERLIEKIEKIVIFSLLGSQISLISSLFFSHSSSIYLKHVANFLNVRSVSQFSHDFFIFSVGPPWVYPKSPQLDGKHRNMSYLERGTDQDKRNWEKKWANIERFKQTHESIKKTWLIWLEKQCARLFICLHKFLNVFWIFFDAGSASEMIRAASNTQMNMI